MTCETCEKCRLLVTMEEQPYIVCTGPCSRVYHADCVGLDEVKLDAVSPPNKNSCWMCDACLIEFVKWRAYQQKKVADPIVPETKSALQLDVDELKIKVASIMSTLASTVVTHTLKTKTMERHSTPCSSSCLDNAPRENS